MVAIVEYNGINLSMTESKYKKKDMKFERKNTQKQNRESWKMKREIIENKLIDIWRKERETSVHTSGHSKEEVVRKYGFKLEGGEWFKECFHKLLSLEWNYFEKTWLRIQFAKTQSN